LFTLPGGDAATKEPRRAALGLLFAMVGEEVFDRSDLVTILAFSTEELRVLKQMMVRGVQSPETSSMGRLFDAVASIIGARQRCSFEGQAAMELEFAAATVATSSEYPFAYAEQGFRIDWEPMIRAILDDVRTHQPSPQIAARFHNTLVRMIIDVARRVGEHRVVLTGGCFQNLYLCERTITGLQAAGFQPYWHQRVPPNDGGISLGQIIAGAERTS
jgi:hydrogenase maturation protein HypF